MICSICASLPLRAAQVSIHDPKNRFWSKPCSKHYINVAQAIDTLNFQSYLKNEEIIRNIDSFWCWSRSRYHWLSLFVVFLAQQTPFETKTYRGSEMSQTNSRLKQTSSRCYRLPRRLWGSSLEPVKSIEALFSAASTIIVNNQHQAVDAWVSKKKVGFKDWLSGKELNDPRTQLSGLPEMSLPPRWSYIWGLERRISAKPRLEDKLRSPKEARFGRIDIDHPLSVSWIEDSECHWKELEPGDERKQENSYNHETKETTINSGCGSITSQRALAPTTDE